MKAVNLWDLRNLYKNPELKTQFNDFMTQKYEELWDDAAQEYFNTNPEFRKLLKFIRKGALDVADVFNFLDVNNKIANDWKFSSHRWQHLSNFTKKMVDYVKIGKEIDGYFNGIKLSASRSWKETSDWLISVWHTKSQKQQEESAEQKKQSTVLGEKLINELQNIDFWDVEKVLDWLCDLEKTSYKASYDERLEIVRIFKEQWLLMNMNLGKDFDESDPDNVARYIIWQWLSWIWKFGKPPQLIPYFVNERKGRFPQKSAS